MGKLRQDDADELGRFNAGVSQLLADDVGEEIIFLSISLYFLATLLADTRVVAQRARYGRDRYAEVFGNVAHSDVLWRFGRLIVHRC